MTTDVGRVADWREEMGLFEALSNLPSKETQDGSIADLIRRQYQNRFQNDRKSRDYYYLTDLCNPIQAYWSRLRNDVERSPEIANKLALGVRLHRNAFSWLRKIPNYVCEETSLNGGYVGIERVIGRYDMRWGESIIEFKTKPNEVADVDTIVKKYPQDLEQLCFYAALSPMEMREHFLIFQLDHAPFTLAVFRIEIKSLGDIRTHLKQRRDGMDTALQLSDPSLLGKCRYYEEGCDFRIKGVCKCDSANDLAIDSLLKSISISFDSQKTYELNSLRESVHETREIHHPWHLFKPRPYYLDRIHGIKEEYAQKDIAHQEALEKAFYRTAELKPKPDEIESFNRKPDDLQLLRNWRGASILTEKSEDGEKRRIAPVILRVSTTNKIPSRIFSTYRAELAMACASSSCAQGLVVVLYPNCGENIHAYRLSFKEADLSDAKKMIEKSIADLDYAIDNRRIDALDICPSWGKPCYCNSCPDKCNDIVAGN
jgi:hypothetical protein